MCPCCRCPGCSMFFPVRDMQADGERVAMIGKRYTCGECCPCPCFTQGYSLYGVRYEKEVETDYKMMLMAMSVFIHARFFENVSQADAYATSADMSVVSLVTQTSTLTRNPSVKGKGSVKAKGSVKRKGSVR